MMTSTNDTTTATVHRSGDDFDHFAAAVRRRVAEHFGRPLFTVAPTGNLFDAYLASFADPAERQIHNCHACHHFIRRYGRVVTIENGETVPIAWSALDVPPRFRDAVAKLAAIVQHSPVDGVFLSSDLRWGEGASPKGWTHFDMPSPSIFKHALLTADQAMAEKREDRGMLCRALAEYPVDAVKQAVALLGTDALYRSEKVLGVAQWFLALHEATAATKNKRTRENLIWQAVATAPPGFCHVRSSMIGTLLDDITAGKSFDAVARAFAEKMHPLQYQRPTAPPSDGNIAQAEKIIATLRTAGALDRRFARVEDLVAVWMPPVILPRGDEAPTGGVFAHLRDKQKVEPIATGAPPATMTWEKFARTVLPTAERIEFSVPGHGNFFAFVTAVNPDAPPIIQWDREEKRNPVTWYLYNGGSMASAWNLTGGAWHRVTAVTMTPPMWDTERPMAHQGKGVTFILDGAKDTRHDRGGGNFPENLRSEYHAIRRTLEAHFQQAPIAGRDEASACGIIFQASGAGSWNATIRVTSRGVSTAYRLDRWD